MNILEDDLRRALNTAYEYGFGVDSTSTGLLPLSITRKISKINVGWPKVRERLIADALAKEIKNG